MKTQRNKPVPIAVIAAIAMLLGAFSVQNAKSATIIVTSTADNGAGTLREALATAADGDTIKFAVTTPATIKLATGELVVSNSVTIVGPGPDKLAVDGNAASRVFLITDAVTAAIFSLTITNGAVLGVHGGGIYNDHATLTVSNCTLSGNSALLGGGIVNDGCCGGRATQMVVDSTFSGNSAVYGGGIFNDGEFGSATLTVVASTLSGNSADGGGGGILNSVLGGSATLTVSNCILSGNSAGDEGGGIFNFNEGEFGSATLTVVTSTLSGNSAAYGGGIVNVVLGGSATLTVVASTLSGNSAGDEGGGIFNLNDGEFGSATLTVVASTLSGNSAGDEGGGIYNDLATLEIGDTILKAGALGTNIGNFGGTVTSRGYNLSSDDEGGGAGTGPGGLLNNTGDQRNTDPMLGPLQDNGGPTFTHMLLAGSPAIDQGKRDTIPALALNTDQRGLPRPVDDPTVADAPGGDGSDIGAFEVQLIIDSDGDGVPDSIDQCPNTPAGAIVNCHGCSINQLVPCDGPVSGGKWKNHGQYVRAIVKTLTQFLKAKLITRRQWVEIVTRAAHSKCGWNRRCDHDGDRDWHRNWDCDRDQDWGRDHDRD